MNNDLLIALAAILAGIIMVILPIVHASLDAEIDSYGRRPRGKWRFIRFLYHPARWFFGWMLK